MRRWPAALLLASVAVVGGCKKDAASRRPQPSASNAASNAPYSMTLEADLLFERGEYGPAAEAYERVVDSQSEAASPEALFRLAVAYELSPDADAKRARTLQLLRQVSDFPGAGRVASFAKAMMTVMERNRSLVRRTSRDGEKIKQLSDELERLKKIDLRERPPR